MNNSTLAPSIPTNDTTEEWRDIPGYEGRYQVSSMGQVRSLDRWTTHGRWGSQHRRFLRGKLLHLSHAKTTGYLVVGFCRGNSHIVDKREVHALVAAAFLGPRPANHHAHHVNENKHDNRLTNLEYLPHAKHARLHSTGMRPHCPKLTFDKANVVREMIATGLSQSQIATQMGISQSLVSQIHTRKIWLTP